MRTQLLVAIAVLVLGGFIVGGEYFLVRWYPRHQRNVAEKTLNLLPYRNDGLGIEMQVAAGLYGEVQDFPGGVRIRRPMFWSVGPSLSITSEPNPEHTSEFSPTLLAKWETRGTYEGIPQYSFEHTKIMNRDAALIWELKDRYMYLTARVISPERIIEADCTSGRADEDLFMRACEESVRTLKVAGPEPPAEPTSAVQEINPPSHRASRQR